MRPHEYAGDHVGPVDGQCDHGGVLDVTSEQRAGLVHDDAAAHCCTAGILNVTG